MRGHLGYCTPDWHLAVVTPATHSLNHACRSILLPYLEGTIYLHDLRSYQQQTVLGSSSQTKGQANLFSINTSIQTSGQLPSKTDTPTKGKGKEIPIHHSVVADLKKRRDGAATSSKRKAGRTADDHLDPEQEGVPVVVTTLAAGCRRRLVLFSWRDGQWQSPKVSLESTSVKLCAGACANPSFPP